MRNLPTNQSVFHALFECDPAAMEQQKITMTQQIEVTAVVHATNDDIVSNSHIASNSDIASISDVASNSDIASNCDLASSCGINSSCDIASNSDIASSCDVASNSDIASNSDVASSNGDIATNAMNITTDAKSIDDEKMRIARRSLHRYIFVVGHTTQHFGHHLTANELVLVQVACEKTLQWLWSPRQKSLESYQLRIRQLQQICAPFMDRMFRAEKRLSDGIDKMMGSRLLAPFDK